MYINAPSHEIVSWGSGFKIRYHLKHSHVNSAVLTFASTIESCIVFLEHVHWRISLWGENRTKERLTRRSSERFHSADESRIVVTIPSETCRQWLSLNLHHPLSCRSWLMADGVPSTLQHHHLGYHHRTSPYCSKPLPLERRYTSSPRATAMCSKSKS
jgi:hypothetical protein